MGFSTARQCSGGRRPKLLTLQTNSATLRPGPLMSMQTQFWTNPSVLAFIGEKEPIEAIAEAARNLVFWALERGWNGPPFDPFALADLLGITTMPTSEILDARTVPLGKSRFRIEFNPDRPRRRMRYSIFHEIAHTLFPDCAQIIRNRGVHNASRPDDWQLETLCNVAAAEFLLPTGSLGQASSLHPSVDAVLQLRKRYEASAEAALLRIRRLTTEPAIAFSCHRDRTSGRYIIGYAAPTANTKWRLQPGSFLPARTAAAECTAIGYTAKQTERWPHIGEVSIECLGVAPYPGDLYPRVIGFIKPALAQQACEFPITYVRGDATRTRGVDPKLLLQIVNDTALSWGGGGFTAAVKRRWPLAQRAYTTQVTTDKGTLRLGNVVTCELEPNLSLISLIAQHGYGPSTRPRIRYGALRDCLMEVSEMAKRSNASVHMPRIGTGQAGGTWVVVEEIIAETLISVGIKVTVYDLPNAKEKSKGQAELSFGT